ncbi:MAG: ribonuclease R [Planctomycetaceae bacterium]|nr:ribonuclease R [Planctomycetaceae bacterium]
MGIEQNVLELLSSKQYQPLKFRELAEKLNVTNKQRGKLRRSLAELIAAGKVQQHANKTYSISEGPNLISGVVKRMGSGDGFFRPHDQVPAKEPQEYWIPEGEMLDAASGDEVLVRVTKRRGRSGKRVAQIVEIIERQASTFVGTYFEKNGQSYVQVDGRTFNEPVYVGDPGAKGANPDDKVVFDMLRFPTPRRQGEGVITKVLGPGGDVEVDTMSIVYQFGIPHEFPEEVLEDARRQADRFDDTDLEGREDLTDQTIITIDPADARDFDDAISLEKNEAGHYVLGVHIADVSHFVRSNSPLNTEAVKRGTSVYLPRKVIPMLPEIISNGLASLQEGKVRFTKSCFIEFTPDGVPVSTRLSNTAINVKKRFAYEEVLPLLASGEKGRKKVGAKVFDLVERMQKVARILRKRRHDKGMLELSMPEVKLLFDKEGRITGAVEEEHDESHQIIEEFMLAANIAVARELTDRGILFLRRIHPDPDEVKLRTFAEFVETLDLQLPKYQDRKSLQALLDKVKGHPAERSISYGLLRSMKQAEYSRFEVGHYALAEEHYCHFTSPIRRYPDLTVHRIVDSIIKKTRRPKESNEDELIRLGKHCSQTSRRAERAERELTKLKLLRYMEDRIGEELHAIITGVETFGIFSQGIEIPVEGLTHIRRLEAKENFDYDQKARALVGRSTGTKFRLGDPVTVKVAKVDIDRRELDFELLSGGSKSKSENSKKKKKQKSKGNSRQKKKGSPKGKSQGKGQSKGNGKGKSGGSSKKSNKKRRGKKKG